MKSAAPSGAHSRARCAPIAYALLGAAPAWPEIPSPASSHPSPATDIPIGAGNSRLLDDRLVPLVIAGRSVMTMHLHHAICRIEVSTIVPRLEPIGRGLLPLF